MGTWACKNIVGVNKGGFNLQLSLAVGYLYFWPHLYPKDKAVQTKFNSRDLLWLFLCIPLHIIFSSF